MKACMHSLSFSGMVHQGWRSVAERGLVANWMGGVCVCGGGGVHDPMWRTYGLSADGEGEILTFGDVLPCGHDPLGSGVREVVTSDVCVSSNFV